MAGYIGCTIIIDNGGVKNHIKQNSNKYIIFFPVSSFPLSSFFVNTLLCHVKRLSEFIFYLTLEVELFLVKPIIRDGRKPRWVVIRAVGCDWLM